MTRKDKCIKYICIGLAIVLVVMIILLSINQYENYQLQHDPAIDRLRTIFTEFFSQDKKWGGKLEMLNNRNVMKEINLYRGIKSFTLNKTDVHICCRDENKEYYPENMLIYVFAHEVSHVLSESIGHTPEFFGIFEDLLVELTDAGIYDPSQEIITNYCENGDNSEI